MSNTVFNVNSINSSTLAAYAYNGNSIHFERSKENVFVNATEMGKNFGKHVKHWFENPSTHEYIHALAKHKGLYAIGENPTSLNTSELAKKYPSLLFVIKGGLNQQGTWMHEDVALEFARWLSPGFAIWCNDKIKELLTSGVATVNNDDDTIALAMSILQKRLEENKRKLEESKNHVILLEATNKQLLPKAQYTEEVLQSTSTFTTTQMADDLGMSAKALNAKLADLGIQYKQSGQWHLKALYTGKGYTDIRVSKYSENKTAQSMVWTELGRLFLTNLRKSGKL